MGENIDADKEIELEEGIEQDAREREGRRRNAKVKDAEPETPKKARKVAIEAPKEVLPAGIVKEYTQNGFRYQRIRDEKGNLTDIRIQ